MSKVKVGFIGCGTIANTVADTLSKIKDIELYACSSKTKEKLENFKKKFNFKKTYDNYLNLVQDVEVQLVYINNLNTQHYDSIMLALNNNKNVICEKPFTMNSEDTKKCIKLAEEKKLLLLDATWTRYMPCVKTINDLIKDKTIKDVYLLTANLCYNIKNIDRLIKKSLGGGSIYDIGVYPINFAFMVLGSNYKKFDSFSIMNNDGVDETTFVNLFYEGGVVANLFSSINGKADNNGMIYGSNGYIEVININNPECIKVYITEGSNGKNVLTKEIPIKKDISGYEYEFYEAVKLIREKKIESEFYTHKEMVKVMDLVDGVIKNFNK